jgi:hypothetical protein
MLRCAPVWSRPDKLDDFDAVLQFSVESITNSEMKPAVWRQATLPVSKGGLEISKTSELALPAFLALVHSSKDLISLIAPTADTDDVLTTPTRAWCELSGE